MINWGSLKKGLKELMLGDMDKQLKDLSPTAKIASATRLSKGFALEYNKAMVGKAEDLITGNKLLIGNMAGMIPILFASFSTSITMAQIQLSINSACVIYWTGAILSSIYKGRPPGHVALIPPCIVVFPGIMNFMPPPLMGNNDTGSIDKFLDAFVRDSKLHLSTITGLHTMIQLPLPAPPYPLPWVGIK